MGACNSSNRTSAAIAESFKQPFAKQNKLTSKKSKLSRTVSFLDSLSQANRHKHKQSKNNNNNNTSLIIKNNSDSDETDEINNNYNHLPKIELDLLNAHYQNNNYYNYNSTINEIEEYDNAVLDYFSIKNSQTKLEVNEQEQEQDENIIYADEVSYPFPTVILNQDINTLHQNPLINFTTLLNNEFECSSFIDLNAPTNMSQLKQQQQRPPLTNKLNSSTDNSLNTLSTSSSSSSSQQNSFESSSSSSFLTTQKLMQQQHQQQNSSKLNRFGFKPTTAVQVPLNSQTKMPIKSDSSPQQSNTISSSMPNSTSSHMLKEQQQTRTETQAHQRNKSPFRSFLPRPPPSTSLKSQPSIPTSVSNSISIAGSVNGASQNMSRTVSTSGVSSTSKHNQSSSLSSLSSTASSNLSNNLQVNDDKIKKMQIKKSPTKIASKVLVSPTINTLSSSKLQTKENNTNQTNHSPQNHNSKRRLFSPYTLNIQPTHANSIINAANTSATSINLNQMYSSDFNNNINKISPSNSKQSNIKPPTIVTSNQFKIYSHLNNKKLTSQSANVNKTLSKMPVKSSSSIKLTNIEQPTSNMINYSNHSPVKKDLLNGSSLMKREDSAYCSSTSSTVSSHDPEINKSPAKVITPQPPDVINESLAHEDDLRREIVIDSNNNEETDSEFNHEEDYTEDNLNTIDNLKQTIMNLDLKSSSNILNLDQISELNFDLNKQERNSVCSNNKLRMNRNSSSIRDSIGELSQLMTMSVSGASNNLVSSASPSVTGASLNEDASNASSKSKQRRTSSTSLTSSNLATIQPMFRPPSNLPPTENSEIIQIDIDSFRLIMQDIQNTKIILYKLANILREPASNTLNNSDNSLFNEDLKPDDLQSLMATNPLISSFYNYQSLCHNFSDRVDQSTQTE